MEEETNRGERTVEEEERNDVNENEARQGEETRCRRLAGCGRLDLKSTTRPSVLSFGSLGLEQKVNTCKK